MFSTIAQCIVFGWSLTLGTIPQYELKLGPTFNVASEDVLVQRVGLNALVCDHFFVWTEIETYDTPLSLFAYAPFRTDYSVGAEVRISEQLKIGAVHECIHPVVSSNKPDTNSLSTGTTEFFVTIKSKGSK